MHYSLPTGSVCLQHIWSIFKRHTDTVVFWKFQKLYLLKRFLQKLELGTLYSFMLAQNGPSSCKMESWLITLYFVL